MPETTPSRRAERGTRRHQSHTIESQLVGKLGREGYGKLLDELSRAVRGPRRRRRGGGRRA